MARGRMISKSLSTSERFASLHDHAGKLAEFCQSLYPLMLAHADDFGRLQGDVFTIKHLVHPTSPRRLTEFEAALKALHNSGLIVWYEVDDKWYVYLSGWFAHQQLKGHDKDGRKSAIPDPPENPSKFELSAQICPKSPKVALTKEKRTELKGTYTVGADEPAPGWDEVDEDLGDGGITSSDIGAFIRRFCELYNKHRHGAKYFVKRKQHVPLVRQLLRIYDARRLEKLCIVLLTTDDEWVRGTDRGIGILAVKASWLDGMLAEYEAQHGEIRVAS